MNVLERAVVVLVRPEGPLNVGSVARLCGNFGCALRLVQPLISVHQSDAMKMAHPSQALLEQAPVFATLGEALADVSVAMATSSKLAEATAIEAAWRSTIARWRGQGFELAARRERGSKQVDRGCDERFKVFEAWHDVPHAQHLLTQASAEAQNETV
jgi:tRNA/rRNA methyltransferase